MNLTMNYEKSFNKNSKSDGGYDNFVLMSLNISKFILFYCCPINCGFIKGFGIGKLHTEYVRIIIENRLL